MIASEDKEALERQHRTLVLVWVGFLATLAVYLALPWLGSYSEAIPLPLGGPSFDISRTSLWATVVVIVGILWWWNQRFLAKEALLKNYAPKRGTPIFSYAVKKIVAFALAEAVAIYGLILALSGRHLWDQLVLSVIAALFLLYLYPSRAFFEELLREMEARTVS